METVTTLRNPGVDYVSFELPPVMPTCPVTGEAFAVVLEVQYCPDTLLIEYIEFVDAIRTAILDGPMLLEDLVVRGLRHAVILLGDIPACVIGKVVVSSHCTATAAAHTDNWRLNE